ncbi:MAG: leucine-rich repeat protein [Lachnospiraceae bacterium]|nr:leucine-rich repeat protein [Lachnospiraceae bacterium]
MKWKRQISVILSLFLLCMDIYIGDGLQAQAMESADKSERETLDFNTDWLYSSMDYENGEAVRLDDSGFDKVSVPHANTVLETHKGNDFPNEIASYRFVSWYRRHFTLPEHYAGKHISVDFEGVATIADVYLNGDLLANHKGAYTGFSVDITDKVYTDGRENVLAVRVNSERQPQLPPEGGNVDYCLFGGIVRDVNMTITNPVHIERVFVTTPGLTKDSGVVKNCVDILNSSDQGKTYTVETEVLDREGKSVVSVSKQTEIQAGLWGNVEMTTEAIDNPHLWDVDDPYLYTAVTKIIDGKTIIDTYQTRFGMRFLEFKKGPEDGSFYLNGKKTEIIGINRHEQWPWIGRAVPDKLQVQDADLIKANGINAVRCSHYPQDPSFLDRCDEIGLLVFEEPPGWQHVGDNEWKAEFKNNLEEMILRDRNHPSIISWSARPNESSSKGNLDFNRECEAISKQLDPTRDTHGVRWEFGMPGAADSDTPDNDVVVNDLLTVNYRYPENPPHIPYMVTEHSNDWWGDGYSWAKDAAAIKFIDSFAEPLDYFYRNDKVAGGFGWSMFDYDNEVNYTKTEHVFYSGLYDIFRHEKAVSYLYKSQMEPGNEPVIYIANSWTKEGTDTDVVYVMSNCEEVELFVNGISKGKIKPNKYENLPHPIYEFKNITYAEGELKAVGYIGGKQAGEYVRKTPGAAVRLIAEADYSTLTADGTDMTSVSVTAVDANGSHVPFAANKINVAQTGGAETTLISERNAELENGKIAFLVQSVRDSAGTAQFTVTSEGLESASAEIKIEPFVSENLVPAVQTTGTVSPKFPNSLAINDNRRGDGLYEFNYQGSGWVYAGEKTAHQGDNHYSQQAGDTVEIRFVGTNLKYYGAKANNHGVAAFSIDGGAETKVDCYAAARDANALLFDTGIVEYGEHVVKVRVTGEKNGAATDCYLNADKIEVSAKGGQNVVNDHTMGDGEFQFKYSDGWAASTDASCYQGDNYWSNTKDASLTFRFSGTSVKFYSTKAGNIGIAAFSVDNGAEQTVDLYQANKADQQLAYEASGLTPGSHTLKVRVTGEKNAASSDCCVVADKIEVSAGDENCSHECTELWNEVGASCAKPGYTGDTYCLECGAKLSEGKEVLASGHRWDNGVVTKKPTINKTGIKTFTCRVCKVARTETVAKRKAPKKGSVLKDAASKAEYQVLTVKASGGKVGGTVSYVKPTKASAKNVAVPAKITVDGATFTVTAIADMAFRNNRKLTKVTVGSNVATIGANAFSGCTALTKLTIPAKVKKIGKQAFYGCKKLRSVTVKTTKLTKSSVGSNAFKGIHAKAAIKVPKSKVKTYQTIFKARGAGKGVRIGK